MNAIERHLVEACKERLAAHYGARFRGLILYGSMARGTAEPESDIDLLALLAEPFDYFAELEYLVDMLADLQLESDRYLSLRPAAAGDFEVGRIQLYRDAQAEGVSV